jgi:hypothetical protein
MFCYDYLENLILNYKEKANAAVKKIKRLEEIRS